MSAKLRDQLIGAWKLVSYVEKPVDGSAPFYPMSERPLGIIMYTPDGYMSAQLSKPDRPAFVSGDWFKGTDDDYKQEASTYIAYTGESPLPNHQPERHGLPICRRPGDWSVRHTRPAQGLSEVRS